MNKQSNYFNGLWEVRLLRSARNDSLFEFLRDYPRIDSEDPNISYAQFIIKVKQKIMVAGTPI